MDYENNHTMLYEKSEMFRIEYHNAMHAIDVLITALHFIFRAVNRSCVDENKPKCVPNQQRSRMVWTEDCKILSHPS